MTRQNAGSPHKSRWIFTLSCVALALLKLWLVAEDQIHPRLAPHDQSWFIKAAFHIVHGDWLGPYDVYTLIRQPGYPLWIAMLHFLRIPLRMGTEFFFLISVFVFAYSLLKNRFPAWLCIFIYSSIAFHPISLFTHNEALSENLYASLLLLSLGGMFAAWVTPHPGRLTFLACLIGVSLAVLWNTRHENILVLVYFSCFLVLEILSTWQKEKILQKVLSRLVILLIIPAVCIFSLTFYIQSINRSHYGERITSEMFSKGFVSACQALLRIKHSHARRFVPVPHDVRVLAYQASPTLKKLSGPLENNKAWITFGCRQNGVCDDFSGGWFHFALRHAAYDVNAFSSSSQMNLFFSDVANEINVACKEGRLSCHSVPFLNSLTHLSGEFSSYLREVPRSILHVLLLFAAKPPVNIDVIGSLPPEISNLFDEVARQKYRPGLKTSNTRFLLKNELAPYYPMAIKVLVPVALIAFFILILPIRGAQSDFTSYCPILLLLSVIAPRILLLALLDASSYRVDDFRTIFPIAGLSTALLLIMVHQAIGRVKSWKDSERASKTYYG